MSKGVKRIIFFVRKLHFSCLSKYTVPIFDDRFSELGNTIYHEILRFAIINLKHGTYESPSSFFFSPLYQPYLSNTKLVIVLQNITHVHATFMDYPLV